MMKNAVAAMGLVVPEREAEHGRHPAADEAMQPRGIAARAAQMLQAVGPFRTCTRYAPDSP